jgi:hypothetical protein
MKYPTHFLYIIFVAHDAKSTHDRATMRVGLFENLGKTGGTLPLAHLSIR